MFLQNMQLFVLPFHKLHNTKGVGKKYLCDATREQLSTFKLNCTKIDMKGA
jgi:hypothetical protein